MFKVGDTVRRISSYHYRGMRHGDVGTVARVSDSGYAIDLKEFGQRGVDQTDFSFTAAHFELVSRKEDKPFPLLTVLQMDRVISAAGGTPSVLEEYLDRPLSDFIQNVMTPNSLTLKYK